MGAFIRQRPEAVQTTALLFDPEVALIDNERGIEHSLKQALAAFGLPMPDEGLAFFRSPQEPLPNLLARLLETDERTELVQFFACFQKYFDQTGRYMGELRAGAEAMLINLVKSGRYECHLLSHIGRNAVTRLLERYGLAPYFKSIVSGDRPSCPRIRPALIHHAVDANQNSRWMLLSDHPWELAAAREQGISACALGYGRSPLRVLSRCPAEAIVADVGDLSTLLLDDRAAHPNVLAMQAHRNGLH